MSDFPESGIKLVADTSDYEDKMQSALDLADSFDAIGDIDVSLNATADTTEIDSMQAAIDEIEAAGGTVDFNVDTNDDTKSILDSVNTIKDLKILETVWNIAGTAVDIFGKFSDFAITPMLDLDDAVAKVNAQTGNAIPNARELISGIFYDDLGDSIDQVGNMVIAAGQMHVPIDEAVRAALEFTHTFKDQNPQLVLTTLDQMVKNGLAPDFKTAGDNLTVAFQNGANKGGDLLQTINDNAGAIRDLGLTGPQAMEVFTSGMDAGFKSSQDVLNTLIKIKQNVQAAANNPTSDVSKTLNMLGIANPSETGEAWSLEFFQKVIDGIKNAPVSDTDKMAMFSNLLGAKVGAKEFSNLMRLSPEDWANVFSNVDGASAAAAQTVDDSLRGAIDDFSLAANEAMQNFLSSDQIDLPGKIEALKAGIQDALDVLAKGGTIQEAITVALDSVGLSDQFRQLEVIFNNLVIALLQIVASVQDVTGHGEAAAATRGTISQVSGEKLKLQLETADTFVDPIKAAIAEGITSSDFTAAITNAVTESIASNNVAQAQLIIDRVAGTNSELGKDLQAQVNAALTQQSRASETMGTRAATGQATTFLDDISKSGATAALDDMSSSIVDLTPSVRDAEQADSSRKTTLDELRVVTDNSTYSLDNLNMTTQDLSDASFDANLAQSDLVTTMASSISDYQALQASLAAGAISIQQFNTAVQALIDKAATLPAGGGTPATETTPVQGAHAGGTPSAIGTFLAGEHGPELITSNRALAVLNNQTTSAIMAALQGFIPGGGGVTRAGGNSYQLNQTNVVQSMAEADMLGYRTAQQIRGM